MNLTANRGTGQPEENTNGAERSEACLVFTNGKTAGLSSELNTSFVPGNYNLLHFYTYSSTLPLL